MVRGHGATSTYTNRDAEALLGEVGSAQNADPEPSRGDLAFGEIVRRYAAMVYAVCLRVCGNAHDAEDATQAAFLTLAVQVKSGKPVNRLGPWLRQVATRAALDVRRARKRRETHEQRHAGQRMHEVAGIHREQGRNGVPTHSGTVASAAESPTSSNIDLEKLTQVMGEELNRLPPKYRLPLVCLYFSGMTRPQVAKELGCTLGTLGVRVHRGRQMLARRLSERGVAPPNGLLSSALLATAVQAVGRDALIEHAATAAGQAVLGHDLVASITQGVLAALKATGAGAIFAKLKGVAMIFVLVGLSAVAARGATRQWQAVGPSAAEVMRQVSEWIAWPGSWRLTLPKLGGSRVGTPIADAHRPLTDAIMNPSLQWVRPAADDTAWKTLVQAPPPVVPVKFVEEQRMPTRLPAMSLLEKHDEPLLPAPIPIRADLAEFSLDGHASAATLRLDALVLSPALRTDVPWDGAAASAFAPIGVPEPPTAGMAMAAGAMLLLRRRRFKSRFNPAIRA